MNIFMAARNQDMSDMDLDFFMAACLIQIPIMRSGRDHHPAHSRRSLFLPLTSAYPRP